MLEVQDNSTGLLTEMTGAGRDVPLRYWRYKSSRASVTNSCAPQGEHTLIDTREREGCVPRGEILPRRDHIHVFQLFLNF